MKLSVLCHGSLLLFVVFAPSLLADGARAEDVPAVGTRFPVTVRVEATAAAQLRHCEVLLGALRGKADHQAVREVIANLSVIPKRWPQDTLEVLRSYVLTADVANANNMSSTALDALTSALPLGEQTGHSVAVLRRLADTYFHLGRIVEAEDALLRAESHHAFESTVDSERDLVLRRLGVFYSQRNRPEEARTRFKAAAQLRSNSAMESAALHVMALKETARLTGTSERARARQEFGEVQAIVAGLKSGPLSSSERSRLSELEYDLRKLEVRLTFD